MSIDISTNVPPSYKQSFLVSEKHAVMIAGCLSNTYCLLHHPKPGVSQQSNSEGFASRSNRHGTWWEVNADCCHPKYPRYPTSWTHLAWRVGLFGKISYFLTQPSRYGKVRKSVQRPKTMGILIPLLVPGQR